MSYVKLEDARLDRFIRELQPRSEAALSRAADEIIEAAKAKVPVGDHPPHLRDDIHKERGPDGWEVIAGRTETFYGHMVEHGTTHSPPHPFLVPALEERKKDVIKDVQNEIRRLA